MQRIQVQIVQQFGIDLRHFATMCDQCFDLGKDPFFLFNFIFHCAIIQKNQ